MLSSGWHSILITVSLLTTFALSIDRSNHMLFMGLFAKRSSLSKNISGNPNEVFVFGHRNPDTDAVASALVYADFLRRRKINAKAYCLGDLNKETKLVLKKAGIKIPDTLPSHLVDGTAVALVDHNESEWSHSSRIGY